MMNEIILKYLDGEMAPDERLGFEMALKSDSTLNEEYKVLLAAKKISDRMLEAEIKGYFNKFDKETTKRFSGKKQLLVLIIAVLFLLSVVVYYFSCVKEPINNDQNLLYASIYKEPIWPIERKGADSLQIAISLHLSGKSDEAIKILMSKQNDMTYLYWAVEVMVNIGKCNEATEWLKTLSEESFKEDRVKYLITYCQKH